MLRGTRSWLWLIAGALLLSAVVRPGQARAQTGDFDAIDQADDLQKQAIAAARDGDWPLARKLAEEVLILDVSFATGPSRLVLARALQQERNYSGALYELRQLVQIEGVSGAILDHADALRKETEVLQARAEHEASAGVKSPGPGAAIGLLAGGAAPLFVGGLFVLNDVGHAARQEDSGTWAVMGAPLLATGVILEVVGAALLGKRRTSKAAVRGITPRLEGVAFGVDDEQVWIGLSGRF